MADFTIQIAGHSLRVLSLFDSTRDYCRAYLSDEEPEATVSVSREDLAAEQESLRQEALAEGLRPRVFPDPFLDRAVIQRKTAEFLFPKNILLLHGSAVALDGQGYLFTADCGTGKSTHTRLWRQVFGPRAEMVKEHRPFLELTASGVLLHGSPWSGKHGLDTNITVPLRGICILQRGPVNAIAEISLFQAAPMLCAQAGLWSQSTPVPERNALVMAMAERVTLWQMQCNREPDAAVLAHAAMSNGCSRR